MDRLGLILLIPSVATAILAIVRSVTRRQAGLAAMVAAHTEVVPPRPDLPDRAFGSGL